MLLAILATLLAVACGTGSNAPTQGSTDRETSTVRQTTIGSGTEPENGEGVFADSGRRSGGEAGAADRIAGVQFRVFDGYERLLVDFASRDGKAGIPRWSAESPVKGGYVRLRFPGIGSTQIAHEDFVGSAIDELYVVRDRRDGLFTDVFATHAFRYRVTQMREAGRLALDFRGVSDEVPFPPTTGEEAVVLRPREAEEVESPIEVRGYARPFEGRLTVSILDRDRETLVSKTVRTGDWASAWGHFETALGVPGYRGPATVRVGYRSPKDGSFVGTETEIFVRRGSPS